MSKPSFDKLASFYDWIESHLLKDYQGSIDIIQHYLKLQKTATVLDVGGGTGYITKSIVEKGNDCVVLDVSKNQLRHVKHPRIKTIQGNASCIPFKEKIFDVALLVSVLHHIPTPYQETVLHEIRRILKKDGSIFIIEAFHPKGITPKLFTTIEQILVGKTYHLHPDNLKTTLEDIGFKSIEMYFPKDHDWKYAVNATK